MDFTLGYREVIPDQTLPDKWKEIVLSTGSSQSTLQDIKVPEKAGGYCYKDSLRIETRNRFIYWRITHDVLELIEQSLDVNLLNNRVRYKFTDTPILDGISVHETTDSVIILIVTVSSIHQFSFWHPHKINKHEQKLEGHVDFTLPSIFSEASIQNARDSHRFHVIPTAGIINSPVAHAAASCFITLQEEALFALAYNSGIILFLRMNIVTGLVDTHELKQESIVPRFLSGIATAFRGHAMESDITMSLVIHACVNDAYLFALCRQGHLRMWSSKKSQCLTVANIVANNQTQIIQNHALKKMINTDGILYLCAYIKFNKRSEFNILKLVQEFGTFKLIRICTLFAEDQQLVDFSFTMTRLWVVWRTIDMDSIIVKHAQLPLENIEHNCEWESAVLAQPPDKDYIITDSSTDPRQAYINFIFHPGKFSLIDIARALSIYRRSNFLSNMNLSPSIIKERVCMAVEAEIQAEVMDYELMDEDYLEIMNRCWSKFYSCVLQYHLNGSRPVGLLLLHNVYGVILLKKTSFSLLRPMEALEHIILCNEKSHISRFKTTPVLSQDDNTCQDVITLVSALLILEEQLSDDFKSAFEKELCQLKSPDITVESLLPKLLFQPDILFSDFDFQMELYHRLENVKDITSAMAMLLEALTYDLGQPNKLKLDEIDNSNIFKNYRFIFGSQLGISTISEIVTQITVLRFSICRNLLILQQIALSRSELFDSQFLHAIKSSIAPRTVVLTQAYYIVMWICESNASVTSSDGLMESSIQRICLLKLANCGKNIGQLKERSFSILELFIQFCGKHYLHSLVYQPYIDKSSFSLWYYGMLSYATLVAQLIWPISGNFCFPKWLLSSCQFLLVQEYVRLLSTWCEWNGASRKFILAISLLEMGEPQKACDYFLKASNGLLVDQYLSNLFLSSNTMKESSALVLYYLKVIEILEQHNASDGIIELAMAAMTVSEKDDPNLATLHSIVFTQHLNLQHHVEAYNYLNTNPDAARRVDCLRQLVVTLISRKKLIDLILFPYVNMYEDLEKIMEDRARSVDLFDNNYYDFLYSFHINKGNVRKAASVMYEQAMRLGQEAPSMLILSRQTNCLLACINALCLVNEKYQWIVRPIIDQNSFVNEYHTRKKRTVEGDEILQYKEKKQVEVLEIKDIKKEYILVEAKLNLTKISSVDRISPHTCPSEIVAVMISVGLYTDSLYICELYKMCKSSVLENLASQCVKLSQKEDSTAWTWLNQNDIYDLSISTSSAANIIWHLLKYLTSVHERDGETTIHKAVSRKLFHHTTFLPKWLSSSYKKRNAPELLRLMVQMGRLEEASFFSLEYIEALLGKGKELFGFESPLVAIAPPVYLPINTLEILLLELKYATNIDQSYVEVYELLQETLKSYFKIVERVSSDMILMKMIN